MNWKIVYMCWEMETLISILDLKFLKAFLISNDGASLKFFVFCCNYLIVFHALHHLLVLTNYKSYCMTYATSFIPHDNVFPLSILL